MLDLRAITGTPGAATVLGAAFPTVCVNDGASVAGVPINPQATLTAWGGISIAANTIGAIKLSSQDQVDPINGISVTPGAASLLNIVHFYENLPYKTGARMVQMGTNNAVGAALAYLIDMYPGGSCQKLTRFAPNQVCTDIVTFAGAITTLQWRTQAYTPATALPNGKYAILGWRTSALTNCDLIRFRHADFDMYAPGGPAVNYEIISSSTWDKLDKKDLLVSQQGQQFAYLSEVSGQPCCPVFTASNAGTGLVIDMNAIAADTPLVVLTLAKVG